MPLRVWVCMCMSWHKNCRTVCFCCFLRKLNGWRKQYKYVWAFTFLLRIFLQDFYSKSKRDSHRFTKTNSWHTHTHVHTCTILESVQSSWAGLFSNWVYLSVQEAGHTCRLQMADMATKNVAIFIRTNLSIFHFLYICIPANKLLAIMHLLSLVCNVYSCQLHIAFN